jgi:hypothetical protein
VVLGNETDACEKQKFFLIIKPTISTNFFKFILSIKFSIFLTAKIYDIYQCCVYSENPLMMDRRTVRNM